jgi:hypothetical protein
MDASKEVGPHVEAVKTECMLSRHQNAGKHHSIQIANIDLLKIWHS